MEVGLEVDNVAKEIRAPPHKEEMRSQNEHLLQVGDNRRDNVSEDNAESNRRTEESSKLVNRPVRPQNLHSRPRKQCDNWTLAKPRNSQFHQKANSWTMARPNASSREITDSLLALRPSVRVKLGGSISAPIGTSASPEESGPNSEAKIGAPAETGMAESPSISAAPAKSTSFGSETSTSSFEFEFSPPLTRNGLGIGMTSMRPISSRVITSPSMSLSASKDNPKVQLQEKHEKLRACTVAELINTEREYIKDLETILAVFMKPLQLKKDFMTGEPLVPKEDISAIFANISNLIPVNQELLKLLEQSSDIGQAFLQTAEYFKLYQPYFTNHPKSVATVRRLRQDNSQFESFLLEKSELECNNSDLASYLIKPLQRLCKYPLFLTELLKCTPVTNKDYRNLMLAKEKVSTIVSQLDESQQKAKDLAALHELQISLDFEEKDFKLIVPNRRLVHSTVFKQIAFNNDCFKAGLYLFNDVLLLLAQGRTKWIYKTSLPVESCNLCETPSDVDMTKCPTRFGTLRKTSKNVFTFGSENLKIYVFAANADEKATWINNVNKLLNDLKQIKDKIPNKVT